MDPVASELPADVSIRVAEPADRVDVRRVLDAAVLDAEDLPDRLAAGTVLLATAGDQVVGAVVLAPEWPAELDGGDGVADCEEPTTRAGPASPVAPGSGPPTSWTTATHVRSIAVLRRRRDRGIGSALLQAAAERHGRLVADFDADVEPFYRTVATAVRAAEEAGSVEGGPASEGRYWALIDRR